jgi:hypothetical protein
MITSGSRVIPLYFFALCVFACCLIVVTVPRGKSSHIVENNNNNHNSNNSEPYILYLKAITLQVILKLSS